MFEVGTRVRIACTCGDHAEHHKREGVISALPGFPFRDHRYVLLEGVARRPLIPTDELRPVKPTPAPKPAQLSLFEEA